MHGQEVLLYPKNNVRRACRIGMFGKLKKIIFIGCVESSYVLLECLLQHGFSVTGIVTLSRSDINSDFRSLEPLAVEYGIDCLCTDNVNGAETIDFVKTREPDLIYCFGWSRLIGKELLMIPPLGVIGFHPAALPSNRGRHPLIWALVLGLEKTASTFFIMDEGADTGDIISQREITIDYADDAGTLYKKVLEAAKSQVIDFTEQFENDSVKRVKQDADEGNTWRKRNKTDGQIDWRMSAGGIYNLVRALTHPYVGAHFVYKDKEIKVWKCREVFSSEYNNMEPGKVLLVNSPKDFMVKANDGVIHILDCDEAELKEGEYLR